MKRFYGNDLHAIFQVEVETQYKKHSFWFMNIDNLSQDSKLCKINKIIVTIRAISISYNKCTYFLDLNFT